MIRFVDNKNAEKDYLKACRFDNVYGAINSYLFRIYSLDNQGMFWNIYNSKEELCGNLSFANDTFTLCAESDEISEEVAHFVDFWCDFSFVNFNMCKVKSLYTKITTHHKLLFGEILYANNCFNTDGISGELCKEIKLYDVFCLFKDNFPEKFSNLEFSSFNYDMNYRLRHGESFLYGIECDGVLVSALEVMCKFDSSVVLGSLATHKDYRNRGFASFLLQLVTNQFTDSNVYIFADKEELSQFYKKIGFKKHSEWAQLTRA